MVQVELYHTISRLLDTKFNDDFNLPADLWKYRSVWEDFIRIAAFSEAEAINVREIAFTPADMPAFNIRLYNASAAGAKPALLYFHGGNWVGGDLETCDAVCRTLSDGSGYVVIAVDYALAPEHSFPTPLNQALQVLAWIRDQGESYAINPDKIVLAGDNAGGNIVAGLVHLQEQMHGARFMGQLLICPALHYQLDNASHHAYSQGYFTSRDFMEKSWAMYLGNAVDKFSELMSPLLTGNVAHVPPTLLFTAEHDPLRDEGEAYATLLYEHGIPIFFQRFEKTTQNFWLMDSILPVARQAQRQAIDFLLQINRAYELANLETMSWSSWP